MQESGKQLTKDYKLPEDVNTLILLIKRIFKASGILTKSQYVDNSSSSRITPEVQLWLDILKLTVEDWLLWVSNPTLDNIRVAKEIEKWSFKNSFGLEMIALAVYIAFRIEPELFKEKYRAWLRQERPYIIRPMFNSVIEAPFEQIEIQSEWTLIHK